MVNKPIKKLTVKWSKKKKCFCWQYPCIQGCFLGADIVAFMSKQMKNPDWEDFDFRTLKLTIEVTPEKCEDLIKNPPEYR